VHSMRRSGDSPGWGNTLGRQRWRCSSCRCRFTARSTRAFSGRAFPDDIIAAAVRWYVRLRLSVADVVEWLAEHGITVDRSTVHRWVQHNLPLFTVAARRYCQPLSANWHVDETYLCLGGCWVSAYRAIDDAGQVVDVYVSACRNAAAARAFFERAIHDTAVRPDRVTTDKADCYPPVLHTLLPEAEHQAAKYLNNALERDHGHLKQRVRPMRGFKSRVAADTFCRGHGLIRNLRHGYSALTSEVTRPLRLLTVWPVLTRQSSHIEEQYVFHQSTIGIDPYYLPTSLQQNPSGRRGPAHSRLSESARLGTRNDARKIGRNLFPLHRKATISPSAVSKV
jgi:transposase-like protein